MRVLWKI